MKRLMRCFGMAIFIGFCLGCSTDGGLTITNNLNENPFTVFSAADTAALQKSGITAVEYAADAAMGNPEGFRLEKIGADKIKISAADIAGINYGIQELSRLAAGGEPFAAGFRFEDAPDFELRGTVLFLMKEGSYVYVLTPEEFPWFYDRDLLTQYFDYLQANRFNTLFLWTGHLFPSIVEMPEYPEASDLSREEVLRNQEQFRWFTDECAKRNISVLLHFYQIHVSPAMAKAHNIPTHNREPSEFLAKYTGYAIERFLTEFKDVGLYVCPGEALRTHLQPAWIRDVILPAVRACGHNPRVVVRGWEMDREQFKKEVGHAYDNLFTEYKHNIEMIVSPTPSDQHEKWFGIGKKHIVNLHEISDIKPFRWGSPLFIHEMVTNWKTLGMDGAEIYGMVSWRWPYALDKLESGQDSYWPQGKKITTFDRDWIWLAAFGRYLWKADRDAEGEKAYWNQRLAERFGSENAADAIRQWYDVTAPLLPGWQNLCSNFNMNFWPTPLAREQELDRLIMARGEDQPGFRSRSLHPTRPVDDFFFRRYQQRFNETGLTDRYSMAIADYGRALAAGNTRWERMRPDRMATLFVELAQESLDLARQAAAAGTTRTDELQRFITDSEALLYTCQMYQGLVMAAIEKRQLTLTENLAHGDALLAHLDKAVAAYDRLVELTDKTYITATDMTMDLNWRNGAQSVRNQRRRESAYIDALRLKFEKGVYWIEAEDMTGVFQKDNNRGGYYGRGFASIAPQDQRQEDASLRATVTIKKAGKYAVWTHGLIVPREDNRAFTVKVNDASFGPVCNQKDTFWPTAFRGYYWGRFIWQRGGYVDLPAGETEIVVTPTGAGYVCPDAVVLIETSQSYEVHMLGEQTDKDFDLGG